MRVKSVTLKVVLIGALCVVGALGVGLLRAQPAAEPEPTVEERVAAEVSRLQSGDLGARIMAARELATMGPAAIEAVPSLVIQLRDENAKLRGYAAIALGEIAPQDDAVKGKLLMLLFDEYLGVRIAGMQAVQKIHARANALAAAAAE